MVPWLSTRWTEALAAAAAGLAAAIVAVVGGPPFDVPVGFDVALWADGALDARWGQPVLVPSLYPRLCALVTGVGIGESGRVLGTVAVTVLPPCCWWIARRLGASATAAVLAAWFVALSPDLVASGAMFGPDALAALVYTLWLGAVLGLDAVLPLALTTALALASREPALPLAPILALVLGWRGRRRAAAGVLLGLGLSAFAGLAVPTSWVEAFPAVHKFAPVLSDVVRGGSGEYLLDVTAAVWGPFPGAESAVRAAYAARAGDLGPAGRVSFNTLHGLVAHADLWAWAALALVGAWHRRERWLLFTALLPLLGTLLAWSQRRHFLPFFGVEAIALAWLFDRWPRARWALLAGALASGLVLPAALSWARARAANDASVAEAGHAARAHSRWDDFVALAPGTRVDPVLLATAERPVAPRGLLDGALRWRVVAVGASPGPGWEQVHPGVFVYEPAAEGRDCLRGTVAGVVGFGLVPGDNGQHSRVTPGDCAGS